MEICVDSIKSGENATQGGAIRLEVCSALSEDGLTPSMGLIRSLSRLSIPLYAMIRIRSGNFVYRSDEKDAMLYDIKMLEAAGAHGFVVGALNPDKTIDEEFCRKVISATTKPVTFHRAFDEVKDPTEALEQLINLGFKRVLTSGQKKTALKGISLIHDLIVQARGRIIVMPGSGINPDNIWDIKNSTKAVEFHASARVRVAAENQSMENNDADSQLFDHSLKVTSIKLVQKMVDALKSS